MGYPYVVIQARLINGSSEVKAVYAPVYAEKGGKPENFFLPGVTTHTRVIGEVEMIYKGGPLLDMYFPEILVESHE